MELIEKLEARFGDLLGRIKQLEEDNRELATQLEAELGKKREVQERIEALLTKVQTSLD
jgi:cell division protein ZapB